MFLNTIFEGKNTGSNNNFLDAANYEERIFNKTHTFEDALQAEYDSIDDEDFSVSAIVMGSVKAEDQDARASRFAMKRKVAAKLNTAWVWTSNRVIAAGYLIAGVAFAYGAVDVCERAINVVQNLI